MATRRPNRRAATTSADPGRRALRTAAIAAAVVLLVGLGIVAVVQLTRSDDPALEVGGWTLSRDELRDDLEAIEGNAVYRALRDQTSAPLEVREVDEDAFTAGFVAEVLNERLAFRLAEVALEERGDEVLEADRAEARQLLAQRLVGSVQLSGGPEATVASVLEGFGSYRPVLEDGLAHIAALRRSLESEVELPDPAGGGDEVEGGGDEAEGGGDEAEGGGDAAEGPTPEEIEAARDQALDLAVRDLLIETAASEGVTVAEDLGLYDAETATIRPARTSVAGLEPVEEGDVDDTTVPGEGEPRTSGTGTIGPDGSIDFGPDGPPGVGDDAPEGDGAGGAADDAPGGVDGSPVAPEPDVVGPPSAGDEQGAADPTGAGDGRDPSADRARRPAA